MMRDGNATGLIGEWGWDYPDHLWRNRSDAGTVKQKQAVG
ncbi:hypothetical protein DSM3645_26429 [Blastopirellula marina DSM 3645]|uniref:Uncharacterized protein n=1 Tax=Blastopirellula marina DSM 3645 TaxID=314230 RepID=A3ZWJ9_9BACT|nr:hypothetical protein DSM3645_26429 [Blastopirellula marina DSM 3645]